MYPEAEAPKADASLSIEGAQPSSAQVVASWNDAG